MAPRTLFGRDRPHVSIESQPQGGTTFVLDLPLA